MTGTIETERLVLRTRASSPVVSATGPSRREQTPYWWAGSPWIMRRRVGEHRHRLGARPPLRGNGYATEAGGALIRWAMHEHGVLEVFAIVQPDNVRAVATAKRIGMEWVTELGHLPQGRYQAFRIRHADLDYHD